MATKQPHKKIAAARLPQELVLEILYRLPSKCLIKCTLVCKAWFGLIKSEAFLNAYLNFNKENATGNNSLLVLRVGDLRNILNNITPVASCSLHKDKEEWERIKFPFQNKNTSFILLGSCNGVVCLFDRLTHDGYNCIIWNPSINKYLRLPKPKLPLLAKHQVFVDIVGFGFDSNTRDYKVVRIRKPTSRSLVFNVEIYSLNSGSWKVLEGEETSWVALKYEISRNKGSNFVNGSLHWVASSRCDDASGKSLILGFDLRSDKFREITLPNCLAEVGRRRLFVRVFGESSIAVVLDKSDIWVMKDYDNCRSWEKMWSIDKKSISKSEVLEFKTPGEVLIESSDHRGVVSLDLGTQQITRHLIMRGIPLKDGTFIYPYLQSLVLFDKGLDAFSYMRNLKKLKRKFSSSEIEDWSGDDTDSSDSNGENDSSNASDSNGENDSSDASD